MEFERKNSTDLMGRNKISYESEGLWEIYVNNESCIADGLHFR